MFTSSFLSGILSGCLSLRSPKNRFSTKQSLPSAVVQNTPRLDPSDSTVLWFGNRVLGMTVSAAPLSTTSGWGHGRPLAGNLSQGPENVQGCRYRRYQGSQRCQRCQIRHRCKRCQKSVQNVKDIEDIQNATDSKIVSNMSKTPKTRMSVRRELLGRITHEGRVIAAFFRVF